MLILSIPHKRSVRYLMMVFASLLTNVGEAQVFRRAERTFIRGDFNMDGSINITDFINLGDFLFNGGGLPSGGCERAGDFDDSGSLNITDFFALNQFLFNGGPPPSPPHPDHGRDPQQDLLPICTPINNYADDPNPLNRNAVEFSGITRLLDGDYLVVSDGRIDILQPNLTIRNTFNVVGDFEGVTLLDETAPNSGVFNVAIVQENSRGATPARQIHFTNTANLQNRNNWTSMNLPAGIPRPEGVAFDNGFQILFIADQNSNSVFTFPRPNPPMNGFPLAGGQLLLTMPTAAPIMPPGTVQQTRGLHFHADTGRLLVLTDGADPWTQVSIGTVWDVELLAAGGFRLLQWTDVNDNGNQWEGVTINPQNAPTNPRSLVIALDAGAGIGEVRRLNRQ